MNTVPDEPLTYHSPVTKAPQLWLIFAGSYGVAAIFTALASFGLWLLGSSLLQSKLVENCLLQTARTPAFVMANGSPAPIYLFHESCTNYAHLATSNLLANWIFVSGGLWILVTAGVLFFALRRWPTHETGAYRVDMITAYVTFSGAVGCLTVSILLLCQNVAHVLHQALLP